MSAEPSQPEQPIVLTPERRFHWRCAMCLAAALLVVLSWLLAHLIWLPFLIGLFFYLVAGLLVSSVAFRMARKARPIPGPVIVRWTILVAVVTVAASTQFEYLHYANTVGDPPRFADARNETIATGGSFEELHRQIAAAFREAIQAQFPPGGVIGYVRWTISASELELTVDEHIERVESDHAGLLWPLRSVLAILLVAAGLWSGLESLRSATPVRNVLLPGEPYEEDEE